MQIRNLVEGLSVALQISVADVSNLAAQGFRRIICKRTDGEAADQPLFDEIARAAETAGTCSATLWPLSEAGRRPMPEILDTARAAGDDLATVARGIGNDGRKPTRLVWWLKERIVPSLYWQGRLKGHEWMARPEPAD